MVFKKNRNLYTFKRSLLLEYFRIKDDLIDIISYHTYRCMNCNTFTDKLQIHHLEHDGDAERLKFKMDTKSPDMLGYYWNIKFQFERDPEAAHKRYGVLCPECNKKDHYARVAIANGKSMKGKTYNKKDIVGEVPVGMETLDSE